MGIEKQIWNIQNFGIRYETRLFLYRTGLISGEKYLDEMSDELKKKVLGKIYYDRTGRKINWGSIQRFTEKVQCSKLEENQELRARLADKYLVRAWVSERIGADTLIPLIGCWDKPEEIDPNILPEQFVLKCNHGSHMNIIIKNKTDADWEKIRKQLHTWLKEDFGTLDFETHYLKIKKKVVAEELMIDGNNDDLRDYKFYCFNGIPYYCQVISDRYSKECIDFFDMDWEHQPFVGLANCGNSSETIKKPTTFETMKRYAAILAQGFPFVRVDFYEINQKLYFGEMTFTPNSGFGSFYPDEWDFKLGDLWHCVNTGRFDTSTRRF